MIVPLQTNVLWLMKLGVNLCTVKRQCCSSRFASACSSAIAAQLKNELHNSIGYHQGVLREPDRVMTTTTIEAIAQRVYALTSVGGANTRVLLHVYTPKMIGVVQLCGHQACWERRIR